MRYLCGWVIGLALLGMPIWGGAAQIDVRESFDTGEAKWGGAFTTPAESMEFDALWNEDEEAIWDGFDGPDWVDFFLFADELSSNGRFVGDYDAAGVDWVVFDCLFFGTDSIREFSTYIITESGRWFEYAWEIPTSGLWGSYLTPMSGEFWYRWDSVHEEWVQESPTTADWRSVAEVGVSVRTIETPNSWSVYLDDFYLAGAFPAPKAEAGFVEHFDRSYSLWLEDRLSNTSGEEWDALWDYWTGALYCELFEGEPDVIWLFADAFSSFAQLVGDYVAAGVDRVEFEFAADNPGALDFLGLYIITESGRQFEYSLDIPEDEDWYVYSVPLIGGGWFRWDDDDSEWVEETPLISDWREVAEIGIVAESNGEAGVFYVDAFGLIGDGVPPVQPTVTHFEPVGSNQVHLEWTGTGQVVIEHSSSLTAPNWQVVVGPISGNVAELALPANAGFFRVQAATTALTSKQP